MSTTPYANMSDVKRANEASSQPHWFSQETTAFFGTRVETSLYRGRYFITSEDNFDRSERLYTVRYAEDDGTIATIGEFQGHATHRAALAAMWAAINKEQA